MSANVSATKVVPISSIGKRSKTKSVDRLHGRASKELVVAFMGAVGCGLARIVTECEKQLEELGYKVIKIKLSEFIKNQIDAGTIQTPIADQLNRYLNYQSGGNLLRKEYGNEVMAEYALNQIGRYRLSIDKELADLTKEPPRVAYLIDQIKHPEEVMLFRMVYRNLFYLIGVMSIHEDRKARLVDEGYKDDLIEFIMNRDRKESEKFGQQLERSFKLADYFMHNPLGNVELIPEQAQRFFNLVHGHNGITPTKHEHAMYIAHSTALKSSCLSRQVGAVITDKSNRVIAVGTNDVPQYGGGLYATENINDDRCFKTRRICENSAEKALRKKRIKEGIVKEFPTIFLDQKLLKAAESKIDEVVELVFAQSGIPDLIEFSRAVHAEMDAIVSLSRGGGGSTVGASLYATTFPCHNCARHIIAAGIEKVYYIEPYEKSLAPEAHNDSIIVLDHDYDEVKQSQIQKVKFIHFSGVGPRLFPELFLRERGRKDDDGKFIQFDSSAQELPNKMINEYIDSYRTFEVKIAALFTDDFPPIEK